LSFPRKKLYYLFVDFRILIGLMLSATRNAVLFFFDLYLLADPLQQADQKLLGVVLEISLEEGTVLVEHLLEVCSADCVLATALAVVV
jgi:hypothetical protein